MSVCMHDNIVSHWESKQVYKKQHSNNSYKEEIRKISSIIHCHWNIWLTNHFILFKVCGKSYKSDDNELYLNFAHIWHTINKNSLGRGQINYETGYLFPLSSLHIKLCKAFQSTFPSRPKVWDSA